MNWSEEPYVRVYKRDTPESALWPWQSRAIFAELLRKADDAGRLPLGRTGLAGLAALIRMPLEVVEAGVHGLLEDGSLVREDGALVFRNYIPAQYAVRTPAVRMKEMRLRKVRARDDVQEDVSPRDEPLRSVTKENHEENTTPLHAVTSRDDAIRALQKTPIPSHPINPPSPRGGDAEDEGGNAPPPPKRPGRRALADRRGEEGFFTAAFEEGVERAMGKPYAFDASPASRRALDDAVDAHHPDRNTAKRVRWISERAEAFARYRALLGDDSRFLPLTAKGFARWLNDGAPEAAAPVDPPLRYVSATPEPPPAPLTPEQEAQLETLLATLGGMGARPREDVSGPTSGAHQGEGAQPEASRGPNRSQGAA